MKKLIILTTALLFANITQADQRYTDVPEGAWYTKDVLTQTIMQGSEGKFRPTDSITRAEMAAVLSRLETKITSQEQEIVKLQSTLTDEQRVINAIDQNKNSLVKIQSGTSGGSGFYISKDLILTAAHVVPQTTVDVYLSTGRRVAGQVIKIDKSLDAAIIKTDPIGRPVTLQSDIRIGQTVIALGNPLFTYTGSATKGIVSGIDRESDGYYKTQIDAAINSGNSGGPIINIDGEVIGMVTTKIDFETDGKTLVDNIAFALRVQDIWNFIADAITS